MRKVKDRVLKKVELGAKNGSERNCQSDHEHENKFKEVEEQCS